MKHAYTIKVIRDDKVECGEIGVPKVDKLPSIGNLGAAVLESIRRGER